MYGRREKGRRSRVCVVDVHDASVSERNENVDLVVEFSETPAISRLSKPVELYIAFNEIFLHNLCTLKTDN